MDIRIACPSYKRPYVETREYYPDVKIYVDPSEYDDYVEENGEEANIVACPEGVQGNVCRVRNHILDTEFEDGADAVLLIDDDFKGMYYFQEEEPHKVDPDNFECYIKKFTVMAQDMGAYLWGININPDKQLYREYTPFSTTSYIGAPFMCFLNGGGIRFDERLPLKEDYDITLQHLKIHRKVLRVNAFYYRVKQSEQEGGCATYRNFKEEKRQLELLQEKWGSDIVKVDKTDRSHNLTKKKERIDYNPVIKPPIKGV